MEKIITIGAIAILVIMYIIIKKHNKKNIEKKFPPGTGKQCTLTAGKFEWCTPPVKGDNLNGKIQEKKVIYSRELERNTIYEAKDGFIIVSITYEYWDELPIVQQLTTHSL